MERSSEINEIGKAIMKAKSQMAPLIKDSDNPFHQSRYASLNTLMDVCEKPLNDNGVLIVQSPQPSDGNTLNLETTLWHVESGQWIASTLTMPLQKVDPQGMGSAITYARRYALQAMLGLYAEDDDGNAASPLSAPKQVYQPQAKPAQSHTKPAQTKQDSYRQEHTTRKEVKPGAYNLPKLPGVVYVESSINGKPAIVADGSAYCHRATLKDAGFKFDQPSRRWWVNAANKMLQAQNDYDEDVNQEPVYDDDIVPF